MVRHSSPKSLVPSCWSKFMTGVRHEAPSAVLRPDQLCGLCPASGYLRVPRSTVMDAAGSSYTVLASALTVEEAAGPSGSAVKVAGCHWYCALPKVFAVTTPENEPDPG